MSVDLTPRISARPLLLIRPNHLRLPQHVRIHRLEQRLLGERTAIAEHRVQRIELEEVPMPPDRRTRPTVLRALPVVVALARARRRLRLRDAVALGRYVVEHPVHPRRLRS